MPVLDMQAPRCDAFDVEMERRARDAKARIGKRDMHNPPPDTPITWTDLEQWADRGLIQRDQLAAIRAHLAESPGIDRAAETDHPERRSPAPVPGDQADGLNLVTVAYYAGAFTILLAFTFFIGLQWENLGHGGQAAIACGAIAALWAIGAFLRGRGLVLGGNLLIFAGVGVVPLAVFTVLQLAGLWPESTRAGEYRDFFHRINGYWLILEVVSIAVAIVAAWLTGFPLLTLLIGFWTWFLSMDLTALFAGHQRFDWTTWEWLIGALVGLAMLAIGVYQQRRSGDQAWSRWFYLFGHLAVYGNLSALALDNDAAFGLLYLAVYLSFVVASVWLQSTIFLVFGALGCYSYVSKLAFDVFEGSVGFTIGLAVVGLLMVLSAVGYQRSVRPWLETRLAPGHGKPRPET